MVLFSGPVSLVCGCLSSFTLVSLKKFKERHGVIVLGIVRAVDERYRPGMRCVKDGLPRLWIGSQFLKIPAPELIPFRRIVTEPFSKLGARSHVFHPPLDFERSLFYAPGPQALDQESDAVTGFGRLVSTLQMHHLSTLFGFVTAWGIESTNEPTYRQSYQASCRPAS
jgi:hypothetical protein